MAKVRRLQAGSSGVPQYTQPPDPEEDREEPPVDEPAEPGRNPDVVIRQLRVALAAVSVIALALAVAVVFLVWPRPVQDDAAPTPTPGSSAPVVPGADHYVAVNPDRVKPGAVVVEIHDDYQCPWCQRGEQIYGDALEQLSLSGDIDLRIHLRTMVGDLIIGNDSSERAARAATCADTVGRFWAYHSTVFANQPHEGTGFTDDQLTTDFAAQAGITGADLTAFQQCYTTQATSDLVTMMEQEGAAAGINGTPAFFVSGKKVNFDLQANAATLQAVDPNALLAELQKI